MSYNATHLLRRSRKRWTSWATVLAIACCLSSTFVWSASAQDDCYRVVDLGRLAFVPSPAFENFGINNLGQAVFTVQVQLGPFQRKHAFLYLPAAAYGLAAGSHDLHLLAGAKLEELGASRAHDLNDAGVVVGQAKTVAGQNLAFVWDLADVLDNDEQYFDLGSLDVNFFTPESEAWAINNDDPPFVVGDSLALGDCTCPDDLNNQCVYRGFRVKLQGNDPQMVELSPNGPGGCDTFSYARDVAKLPNPPSGDPEIVGLTFHSACSCPAPNASACGADKDAAQWTLPAPVLRLTDLGPQGSESRGVNDDGAIVGWGYANAAPDCQMSALFWEDAAAAAFNLGTVDPIDPVHQTRAEAITNPDDGDMTVVGSNDTTQHALRWEGSGVAWSVVDLNDKIVNQCAGLEDLIVVRGDDVSDDGWIISVANVNPGGPADFHAVILVPDQDCTVSCFADLNGDGTVSAGDLLALLAAWGSCVGCAADLDCDGVVGASDVLQLLGAWGTCETAPPPVIPKTVQDCYNRFFPNDLEALIACIEAIE